jgi:hypothetical protein
MGSSSISVLGKLIVIMLVPAGCACAELGLMSAKAAAEAPEDEDDNLSEEVDSAAALLERGFLSFRHDQPADARQAFTAAIATGNLNDAGRAVAYWHIFLANQQQGDVDGGAEALNAFLVAAQDLLDERGTRGVAATSSGDFVDRFDLERRMARARAVLSAVWAAKVLAYGRSAAYPVVVKDETELGYFLELAPPCAQASDRQVVRRVGSGSGAGAAGCDEGETATERVTIRCSRARGGIDYYIESSGPARGPSAQ